MKKFGGAPKCPVCGKSVYATEMVRFNEAAYHKLCLRCATCRKSLAANQAFVGPEKTIYCRTHLPAPTAEGTAAKPVSQVVAESKPAGTPAAPKPAAEEPRSVAPGGKLPKAAMVPGVGAKVMGVMLNPQSGALSRRVFAKYDTDGDGSIGAGELRALCMEMGVVLSAEQLDAALRVMDMDGNGTIELDEFERWWASEDRFGQMQRTPEEIEYLQSAFAKFVGFDTDGNGTVDRDEFAALHDSLVAEGYTTHSRDDDWDDMDRDRSGTISFAEYHAWLVDRARAAQSRTDASGVTHANPFAAELAAKQAARAAAAAAAAAKQN